MKYLKRVSLALFVLVAVLVAVQVKVFAAEDDTITDAQLVQIKNNCTAIQSILSRVHASDALVRVNQGQLYESISSNLMAPLNSRVSLNQLDSTPLVSVTNLYQQHLQEFRDDYQTYEESLSATLRINCNNQPTKFYEALQQTRTARKKVHGDTTNLTNDIKKYKHAFENFAKSYKGDE